MDHIYTVFERSKRDQDWSFQLDKNTFHLFITVTIANGGLCIVLNFVSNWKHTYLHRMISHSIKHGTLVYKRTLILNPQMSFTQLSLLWKYILSNIKLNLLVANYKYVKIGITGVNCFLFFLPLMSPHLKWNPVMLKRKKYFFLMPQPQTKMSPVRLKYK